MNFKKGLSLPINLIVILSIAVLVLVVVAAFFAGIFGPQTGSVNLETALQQACQKWNNFYKCATDITTMTTTVTVKYQAAGETSPSDHSINDLCTRRGYSTDECKRACGCPTS